MALAFDTTRCGMPALESILGLTIVADCAVPTPPAPIYDCGDPVLDPTAGASGLVGPPGPAGVARPPLQAFVSDAGVTAGNLAAPVAFPATRYVVRGGGIPGFKIESDLTVYNHTGISWSGRRLLWAELKEDGFYYLVSVDCTTAVV